MPRICAVLLVCLALSACRSGISGAEDLERAIRSGSRVVELPAALELDREIEIPGGDQPLVIRGRAGGSAIRVASGFRGSAVFRSSGRSHLRFAYFTIEGRRDSDPRGLPPWNVSFADFYRRNAIVVRGGRDIAIEAVRITGIADYPIIVSGAEDVRITGVKVEDSGSRNEQGRNNASGGILMEEGVKNFEITGCTLTRILGNAIWTHSNQDSPRNMGGRIASNVISFVGRDAIQVGHASRVVVENNQGQDIGYPFDAVDVEHEGTPVALDTSGFVDGSAYRDNRFRDVNGECINLDGFQRGEALRNQCLSEKPFDAYPHAHYGIVMGNTDPNVRVTGVTISRNTISGTGYGGLYLIGSGGSITNNRFLMLNRAGCTGDGKIPRCNYALEQPDLLRSGIYLARGAVRPDPASGNVIRGNEIQGFGMDRWCVQAAPGVAARANTVADNVCRGEPAPPR